MAPTLVLAYQDKKVVAADNASDAARFIKNFQTFTIEAEAKLGIPQGTYDFYDKCGRVEKQEDLQRAFHSAGDGDCIIELREHSHYIKLRALEQENLRQNAFMEKLEAMLKKSEKKQEELVEETKEKIMAEVSKTNRKINSEIMPQIEALTRDRNEMQKDIRSVVEKLSQINVKELQELTAKAEKLQAEITAAVQRVDRIDHQWAIDKAHLNSEINKGHQDLQELKRWLQGKVDLCIEADADLRRDQQLCGERMQIVADDLRLLMEDFYRLERRCSGALEESEDLRTLLGQVREDNEHLRSDCGSVMTRVHCIEGTATEKWEGFAPGVLYFRQWHKGAKGGDVQLSADLQVATGRGFLAATGVVIGCDEGLVVGDGPCRRFGTPGSWFSYYELEVDEICAAPEGAGGLYVGLCIQSGEEIAAHPKHEFDGWLCGGPSKALICRAGDIPDADPGALPATYAPDASEAAYKHAKEAIKLLRAALPPRPKGEVQEADSNFASEKLRMGDRIAVLFRVHRDGGARMRIGVNGDIVATKEFINAPPAEAVGFLTPVVRLAGTGKSAKLLPGLTPPSRMLVD
jgi:hypothetical protein